MVSLENKDLKEQIRRNQFCAIIDISYDDATRTVSFSQRKGQFNGMLKERSFNVVLITKENPKPLNLDNPEGRLVNYNGKAVSVQL